MAIKFITGNKKKLKEVQDLLAPFEVEQLDIDIEEIQSLDAQKIIEHKVQEALALHNGEFILEDTSLYMQALGGKLPGTLIKWFNETIGNDGLYNIAAKFGNTEASVKTVFAYAKSKDNIKYFEGDIVGEILKPEEVSIFGYDTVFMPSGTGKTLAKLKAEGNFDHSSRGIAVAKLKEYLENQKPSN